MPFYTFKLNVPPFTLFPGEISTALGKQAHFVSQIPDGEKRKALPASRYVHTRHTEPLPLSPRWRCGMKSKPLLSVSSAEKPTVVYLPALLAVQSGGGR